MADKNDEIAAAVHVLGGIFSPNAGFYGDTMSSLGCDEAEALIEVFRAAGYADLAESLLMEHTAGDYPEDRHYIPGISREESGTYYG